MENFKKEFDAVEQVAAAAETEIVMELTDLHLALVGGGGADVVFH